MLVLRDYLMASVVGACFLVAPGARGALRAQAAPAATPDAADSAAVEVTWGVRIPLRDGVNLSATLYRPAQTSGRLPTIFTLTPYTADRYHERAMYFARRGYAFALVDVRGRGNSEGSFEPLANEGRDGHDVVEWLAVQPWSDGHVAMWGGSYGGYDQWATLKEAPPHLTTIVPAAPVYPGFDFPIQNGVTYPYVIQWLTYVSGRASQDNLMGEDAYWVDRFRELYRRLLPYAALDSVSGNLSTVFRAWLRHATPDAFWDSMVPSPEQYARMRAPILTITGHYDGDQLGALHYYRRHMRYGAPKARANHFLIIGPWDHSGTRTPKREVGGLTFGEASALDLNRLHLEWYNWTMRGGPRPAFLRDRVAYYVPGAGAETWKYAPSLDSIARDTMRLYLTSTPAGAGGVFSSGLLASVAPTSSSPDHYTYDPRDTRRGDWESAAAPAWITDQRLALSLTDDGVVYHSEPLAKATEVTGWVSVTLWIALDVPDTDVWVRLYEILPDGSSVLLAEMAQRARYRHSTRVAEPVRPGAVERYDFDNFTFFSRRLVRGSRLRLLVTGLNSINWQKNYNSGGDVNEESGAEARVAHVTIYHDQAHPSVIRLPIVP